MIASVVASQKWNLPICGLDTSYLSWKFVRRRSLGPRVIFFCSFVVCSLYICLLRYLFTIVLLFILPKLVECLAVPGYRHYLPLDLCLE